MKHLLLLIFWLIISYGVASASDISSKNYIQVGAGLADTGTRYKDCQFQFGYGYDIAFNGSISVMPIIGVNYYRFDRGVDGVVFEDLVRLKQPCSSVSISTPLICLLP